jgi:hypothetical protein
MRRLVGGYGIDSRPLGRLSVVGPGYLEASALLLALIHELSGSTEFSEVRGLKVPGSPSNWDPSRRPLLPPGAGGECVCDARGEDVLRAVATCYSRPFLIRTSVSGIYAHKKAISIGQGVRASL